jgi:ADP-heptose:LPS heptosyltransferase
LSRNGKDILREELRRGATPEVWVRFPRQLGDIMFAMPFFESLRKSWDAVAQEENVKLRWIAVGHAIGAALFSEASPDFMAECLTETGGRGKPDPVQFLKRWRRERPVAVLNLSQSVRLILTARLAKVPIRAGIADNGLRLLYTHSFKYRDLPSHCSQRYMPLLEQLTGSRLLRWYPLDAERLGGQGGREKLRAAGWRGEPYVALAFGTRGFSKRWFPEERNWPALGKHIQSKGYAVVWLGSPDEASLGYSLAEMVPGSFDLSGKTSIPEVVNLQHGAWGNVTIDTGLAHTAAGLGRPTITIINDNINEAFIAPIGSRVITMRGVPVEAGGEVIEGLPYPYLSAHRIDVRRIWTILEALAHEEEPREVALECAP